MNQELIRRLIETPTEENFQALGDDYDTILWVDWRHDDDEIVSECASILKIDSLTAERKTIRSEPGLEMYISYRDKRVKVPLVVGIEDRHITLCSLNEALWPDYEVRYCIASGGSDTLAFLPLPMSDWQFLERQYGDAVHHLFYRLTPTPNLFTDTLPPELIAIVLDDHRTDKIAAEIAAGPPPGYVPEPPPSNAPKRRMWRPWNKR